ncbi:SDR family oxidoreductase [Erythrobacter sp. F6033]|uniref:SDR family oxidoreductase n=1 Tax=Erythrobacter sp. F6033 TaxID=2926401 RepID=UPI001FF328A1|nr:SDR family oxidoreductase [Erythrobacter sp. F6033]MCK0129293.1 SDR family oxidoreductase [Erythrobacter sp. F6033]
MTSDTAQTSLSRRNLLAAGAALPLATSLSAEKLAAAEPESLKGQSVLITGCSSGFGRQTALYCASLGAKVIATMRNLPRLEADTLRAEAASNKLDLHVVEIDVLDDASVAQGSEEARDLIGGAPDVLINNAGIAIVGPIEAQDIEATRLAYDTNVIGYQRMIRSVLPAMRARGSGQIINVSSVSGRIIWPGLGHYCPTKFAVEASSETLAYEVADQGVDVSIVQPGGYPTDFWENREELTLALKNRSAPEHLDGYGVMSGNMGSGNIPNLRGDPDDIALAIAALIARPAGERPLRVMVSADGTPQVQINAASRETHAGFLSRGRFAKAAKKVLGN